MVWAFVQPVITVLLYWFVFEKGLNSKATDLRTGIEIPFVLWLTAGLVPWFYFQEALNGGTGVLVEYSYLVKKVVFQIDMPIIKIISTYLHICFCSICCTFHLYEIYARLCYTSDLYNYSFCMILFASLKTCVCDEIAVEAVFFHDAERSGGNPVADRHVGDAECARSRRWCRYRNLNIDCRVKAQSDVLSLFRDTQNALIIISFWEEMSGRLQLYF